MVQDGSTSSDADAAGGLSRKQLIAQAADAATRRLIDAHVLEFRGYLNEEVNRLSAERKAAGLQGLPVRGPAQSVAPLEKWPGGLTRDRSELVHVVALDVLGVQASEPFQLLRDKRVAAKWLEILNMLSSTPNLELVSLAEIDQESVSAFRKRLPEMQREARARVGELARAANVQAQKEQAAVRRSVPVKPGQTKDQAVAAHVRDQKAKSGRASAAAEPVAGLPLEETYKPRALAKRSAAVSAASAGGAETDRCPVSGKVTFSSEAAVKKRLTGFRSGDRLRAYKCEFCGGWHMTSQVYG